MTACCVFIPPGKTPCGNFRFRARRTLTFAIRKLRTFLLRSVVSPSPPPSPYRRPDIHPIDLVITGGGGGGRVGIRKQDFHCIFIIQIHIYIYSWTVYMRREKRTIFSRQTMFLSRIYPHPQNIVRMNWRAIKTVFEISCYKIKSWNLHNDSYSWLFIKTKLGWNPKGEFVIGA